MNHDIMKIKCRSIALSGVLFFLAGLAACGTSEGSEADRASNVSESETVAAEPQIYTCPMHPQIRQDHPGDCPICEMELVPVESGGVEQSEIALQPSERAVALMNIRTSTVQRHASSNQLEVTGRIAIASNSEANITAWANGRIDRLYVESVGEQVRRGYPVARMHSHEIAVAAEDLKRATRIADESEAGSLRHRTATSTVNAARDLLVQLGLQSRQIDRYAEGESSTEHVTIYAPTSGTVLERMASEGDWVTQGQTILSIADLDEVWANLEVYQEDLGSVHEGDPVTLYVPGFSDPIEATINFVEPVVNPDRRIAIARVILDNTNGRLRPETLIRARIGSAPSVPNDAESSGESDQSEGDDKPPVTVPSSAILWTGERSLVYVKDASGDPPIYMPVEVEIGRRLGERTEIISGVFPGETVVTNGAFRLDSSLQIKGGRSMMAPDERMRPSSGGSVDMNAPENGGHRGH